MARASGLLKLSKTSLVLICSGSWSGRFQHSFSQLPRNLLYSPFPLSFFPSLTLFSGVKKWRKKGEEGRGGRCPSFFCRKLMMAHGSLCCTLWRQFRGAYLRNKMTWCKTESQMRRRGGRGAMDETRHGQPNEPLTVSSDNNNGCLDEIWLTKVRNYIPYMAIIFFPLCVNYKRRV